MSAPTPNVALFRGEDAFAMERAVRGLAAELGEQEAPLAIWRIGADDEGGPDRSARLLERLEERVGSAPLFGGGTLVVLRQPSGLLREKVARERLLRLVGQVPPGNGLALCDLREPDRRARGADPLATAVEAAGGRVRDFPAPTRERMEGWLAERAAELAIRLGPGAARLLAERVGAYVREGDIDRKRQTELADQELQKLALLRPDGIVSREDVAELVPEAVPGSVWALLDAVAARRAGEAARLAERVAASGTPAPVVIAQLHRRLRELVIVREHLAAGARPAELVRTMRLQPYRAEKLAQQAGAWELAELEAALAGLLEVDLASKGISLTTAAEPISEERTALRLAAWLAGSVARRPAAS